MNFTQQVESRRAASSWSFRVHEGLLFTINVTMGAGAFGGCPTNLKLPASTYVNPDTAKSVVRIGGPPTIDRTVIGEFKG